MHESDPMSVLGIGCQSIWLLSHIAREDLHDSMPFVMINTPTSSFPADTCIQLHVGWWWQCKGEICIWERERESQSIRTYSLKKKKKIEETNRISSNVRAPDTLVNNNT